MIRERRAADLEPLCAIVETLQACAGFLPGRDPRSWLVEHEAEVSWVFDMAPVTVAPTTNVVGHVQVHLPVRRRTAGDPVAEPDQTPDGRVAELVIGRLFVRPQKHDLGIARFLLREAVRLVRDRGAVPVLHLEENALPTTFLERFGFRDLGPADPGAMVLPAEVLATKRSRRRS